MKKKIFLLSIMSIVALTAASDEYIDPLTNVVYTYEPGQPTASVKAGYADVVVPDYGSEGEEYFCPGSPDATGDVVILDKFTIGTTEYVVTSIGDCAFWYNRKIKSVSIPETVTDIGSCAFCDCTDLTTVQLPSGLMRIAEGLFRNCSHLVTVNIPSSVSTIGAYAFADCSSLASITIPDGLTIVGKFAFNRTPWYVSQYDNAPDGLFYINSLLFGYKGEKPTGELIIKNGTTCVCNEAFRGCKELTSVIIPPSVVYVDEYAFEDCTGLKAVRITDIAAWCGIEFQYGNLNHNSSNPLWYAHHLYLDGEEVTELIVPKGVTRIGKYAFDSCSSLTSVTLSDGVTSIGENAFRNCGNLTNVSIPSSVSKIESQAFIWCKKLNAVYISDIAAWCGISFDNTSNPLYYGARLYLEDEEVTDLIIPEGVSSIGDGAFRNYSYLTSVTISEGVTSIGKYAFNTCRKITNLSLPTSLSRICYSAFAHCSSLTSLTLSEGITNIDESAFADCGNLTDVYCLADNVPETNRIAFIDSPIESATLHVPAGSIEKYKTTSPWKDFGNIVALDNPKDTLHNHPKYYQDGDYWVQALVPWDFEERIHDYETAGSGENFSLYFFYVEGDTIIDNKEYKCVHAKIWYYDCEATYDHQPEGLIEGPQVANVLFMREDADGKQWRRLAYLNDEALLFDFSHPFEEGQKIRYCRHDNLCDVVDEVSYFEGSQNRVYSRPSRRKAISSKPSDAEAPVGYFYYDLTVSQVTTLELPNGEQVPFADGRIVFGWGDVYISDLMHQFSPVCESAEGMFLYRAHQGQVILLNNGNIQSINNIIGTDVLSLFDKPEGYHPFVEEGKVWNMLSQKEAADLYPDYEFSYFIKGDTLISDLNCKKLYSYNENNTNQTIYKMALYEINKKIYFIPEGSETAHLLYDFGIPVGSTVYTADVIHPEWELEMKNNSDSIVKTGEISRHCLLVNRISESFVFPSGWWIEGIGSELGPLNTWGFEAAGNSVFLLNCEIDGQEIFNMSGFMKNTVEVAIDNLNYFLNLKTHEAILTAYHTCSGEVNIPSEVNYNRETFVVKSMLWCSFYNNQEVTKVRIPKTLVNILHYYPYDPGLQNPPAGMVDAIHMNPFIGCTALESIEVDEENTSLKSVDGVLFSQDGVGQYYYKTNNYYGTGLYCYPEGAQRKSYAIPDGVEWISSEAFFQNQFISTLTIPNSIKQICGNAFQGCSNLADVYCYANNVPVTFTNVFDNFPIASATLHVPVNSVDLYKADSRWNGFGNIVALEETVSYTKDQMATIILPSAPDASKGKYYGLDRCEEGKIIFTEELQPKARVPYIIVPKEDFTIDLSNLELESLLSDTVSVKGAYFIGSYNSAELNCQEGFYIDIIDSTPDCQIIGTDQRKAAIGALRAYLVAPWDDPYTQGPTKGIKNKREIVLQDDPNGIYEMKSERVKSEKYNDAIYDLSGRRVNCHLSPVNSQLKNGIYIQNGRKVAIK